MDVVKIMEFSLLIKMDLRPSRPALPPGAAPGRPAGMHGPVGYAPKNMAGWLGGWLVGWLVGVGGWKS